MRRLYSRIYVHLLAVLLVVGLLASVLVGLGQRGAFQRLVAERLALHVASLVGEAVGDEALLRRRVAQLHGDFEVDVTVWDPAGRELAAAGAGLGPPRPDELGELRAGRALALARPGRRVVAAVRDGTGALAAVVAVARPAPPHARALWRPGLAVGAVLLVAALAAAPLARRISRPLERLTEAARRLGRGDLATRVPVEPAPGRPRAGAERAVDELGELARAFNDMAERIERLVSDQKALLANVSHELRSPLARVRVALELVPREGEVARRLADVEADLAELERLIEDVLTASRLEATGRPPAPAAVEARRLLDELVERARHAPVTAGYVVEVAEGPPVSLVADGALLKRALWNLVENAGKYGAPPVVLAVSQEGGQVLLSVSDAGPGIAPGERASVLAPFYRVDRARTPAGSTEGDVAPPGFGLGLTLARRIAEVHGGEIRIGPARVVGGREHGCTVTLALPAEPPAAAPGAGSDETEPPARTSTREQPPSGAR